VKVKGTSLALTPLVPGIAAVATVIVYLVDWPFPGNHGLQLAVGLGIGLAGWYVTSLLAGDVISVESASARTYEELRGRVKALEARKKDLYRAPHARAIRAEALHEADRVVEALRADLRLDGAEKRGDARSPYRWIRGNGYINAWRDLHRAEDALLVVEPAEVVYATALTNLDRIAGASSKESTRVAKELKTLVEGEAGGNGKPRGSRNGKASEEEAVERCGKDWGRAIVRESAYRIHHEQNDAWDEIVNLRNWHVTALSLAAVVAYAIVALIVLQPVDRTSVMIAAVAFFFVGAIVGVFNELWATSRRKKGTVFDYGLAATRLAATPILSGIAAVIGVLLFNYAGSVLLVTGTAAPSGSAVSIPSLASIFSLSHNPMGLVVAAIFGFAPGLVLKQLKALSDGYEKQIQNLSPSNGG
jgi:hypothetical protein